MLTNDFKVRPDQHGDVVQRYAAEILLFDQHAVCPHDPREARALLSKLRQERGRSRETAQERRIAQLHEAYNAMLPVLARAKRLGVRPRDAKPPTLPPGGEASVDDLAAMREFCSQLDIDVAEFESQTPDQRRIKELEKRTTAIAKHANMMASALNDIAAQIEKILGCLERLGAV